MSSTKTAVLLVAGIGSRLRPLTDDRPKALVDIGGETILGRAVRLLAEHGVERLVLATGYREDAVQSALASCPLEVVYCRNDRFDSTQNAVSLALCRDAVVGRAFFKLDGDVVFRPEVLARIDACDAPLAVAVDGTRRTDAEAMKFRRGQGDRIEAFGKGLALDQAAGESIGIERISAEASLPLFEALARPESASLYYEDVYSQLIGAGQLSALAVEVGDLPWTEVDDPSDLARARALFG
ncbi:MAG: phosphocholine cytidylyltransferase family protein [Myxococcales bacterium]|nr:phosphocholine cytidylyltransferase family protein [Myxococcales bacterium]